MQLQPKRLSITMDMVHSEDEILHGLQHLMRGRSTSKEGHDTNKLQGHETMVLYRNVRKKYSLAPQEIREGLHCIQTFGTPAKGLEAAYRAALCRGGPVCKVIKSASSDLNDPIRIVIGDQRW